MMKEISFIVKIDNDGNFQGYEAERLPGEMRNHFAGKFVKITVQGWEQTESQMRGWYWAGIIPAILKAMRDEGNPVNPKHHGDKKWLHEALKAAYLPPEVDEYNNPLLDDNGNIIHTTKGIGRAGWYEYLQSIQAWAFDQFNIQLDPEKPRKK